MKQREIVLEEKIRILREDHERLVKAATNALPYLIDHIGRTLEDGPGDRCAYDELKAAIEGDE